MREERRGNNVNDRAPYFEKTWLILFSFFLTRQKTNFYQTRRLYAKKVMPKRAKKVSVRHPYSTFYKSKSPTKRLVLFQSSWKFKPNDYCSKKLGCSAFIKWLMSGVNSPPPQTRASVTSINMTRKFLATMIHCVKNPLVNIGWAKYLFGWI